MQDSHDIIDARSVGAIDFVSYGVCELARGAVCQRQFRPRGKEEDRIQDT